MTSAAFLGERIVVYRNPPLADERARKREDLLVATEAGLQRIALATQRVGAPLQGATGSPCASAR